jgi:hypothetical protein
MAATAPPVAPNKGPTTYGLLYQDQLNALPLGYAALYHRHDVANNINGDVLLRHTLQASQAIPKVYLCLVRTGVNRVEIIAPHRPTSYAVDQIRNTPWDDRNFAFLGDVRPGNYIKMVEFPDNAFEITGAQRVPTVDNTTALLAASPTRPILLPLAGNAPDSEDIETRMMVQVPQEYIGLVLGRSLTPRRAWEELAGSIIGDGRENECAHLLNWLRVALTLQANPADATAPLPPQNYAGTMETVFPGLNDDDDIQHHRWNILRQDLPALDGTNLNATDQMIHLVGALRQDRATERANDDARRMVQLEAKNPSETKFKHTALDWMRFSGVTDEDDLPVIYKDLANADKAEHLAVLRNHLKQRVRQFGAATEQMPVASKELLEIVKQAKFSCEPHELNDLTLGLQPFGVGLFVGDSLSKTAQARADGYELMLQGAVNPTLSEQATFSTKEVRIPQDLFSTEMMLCTLSVILDVLQGPNAPLAQAYRSFCVRSWKVIATTLHIEGMQDPSVFAQVIPGILRWLQLHLLNHIRLLQEGARNPPVPDFGQLTNLVLMHEWHQLPQLPSHYRLDLIEEKKREHQPTAPTTPTTPTGHTPPETEVKKAKLMLNAGVKDVWKTHMEASAKRLKDLEKFAPESKETDPRTKQKMTVCLSWHLLGQCYENCRRHKTHRALNTTEQQGVQKLVDEQLQS